MREPRYKTWCCVCDREFTCRSTQARFCSARCKATAHHLAAILVGDRPYRSLLARLRAAGKADGLGRVRRGPLAEIVDQLVVERS